MSRNKIFFYENIGHSPAWPFVPGALDELVARGFAENPQMGPVWNDPCLVQVNAYGVCRGFVCYRYDHARSIWFIVLSYTLPKHRKKGVHSELFARLVQRAKQRGDILSIDSGTHVDNIAAQKAFERQGRQLVSYGYSFRIHNFVPGKDPLEIEHE